MGSTIVAQRQVAEKQLAEWKNRRAARLSQVEELQVCSLSACYQSSCVIHIGSVLSETSRHLAGYWEAQTASACHIEMPNQLQLEQARRSD